MTSAQPSTTPTASRSSAVTGPTDAASSASQSQGTTIIADTVVSKIAGLAARDVTGVYDLGGGTARVVGQLRERIPGASVNHAQGVAVEVGEKQAAVDIDLVAEYGVAITDLAAGIRRNVIAAIERMTGLQVTEVNITVHDVHLEDDAGHQGSSVSQTRSQ